MSATALSADPLKHGTRWSAGRVPAVAAVATHLIVVTVLSALLQRAGGASVAVAASGVVALLMAPVRGRLQRSVDRMLYARALVLAEKTVRNNVSAILTKPHAADRAQAVARAGCGFGSTAKSRLTSGRVPLSGGTPVAPGSFP